MATKLHTAPVASKVQPGAYGGERTSPVALQKQGKSLNKLQSHSSVNGSSEIGRQPSTKLVGPSIDLVSNIHSNNVTSHNDVVERHQSGLVSAQQFQPTPPNSVGTQKTQQRQQQHQLYQQQQQGQQQMQPHLQAQTLPAHQHAAVAKVLKYEDFRMEVGLENLGNTCFMNSTLQCLLHIQPLIHYFLEGNFERELNSASPKKGMLAKSFHSLIHEILNGRAGSAIAPINFQRAVGIFAPYLMDYQQQDSQEFLRFLLDGMSDDLLRRKPQKAPSPSETLQITDVSTPDTSNSRGSFNLSPQINKIQSPGVASQIVHPVLPQTALKVSGETPQENNKLVNKVQKLRNETLSMRDTAGALNDDYYVLSEEDEELNTVQNVHTNPASRDLEQINQSKLRVIKNVAKARELDGHQNITDGGCEQTKLNLSTLSNVTPGVTTPNSAGKASYTATLSNTFRRIRGRTNSEAEDHTSDEQPSEYATGVYVSDPKNFDKFEKEAFDAWDRYLKLNDSIITDIFGGLLQSTVQCCTCNHRSFAFDPFLDLSIPIFKEGEVSSSSSRGIFPSLTLRSGGNQPTENKSTLEKCLEKFTAEEVLDGENMYHCEKCKKNRKSIKKLSIFRYPRVLVIHIKRFRFSSTSREKLSTDVHFPLYGLDLKAYLSPDLQYLRQSSNALSLCPVRNPNGNNNNEEDDRNFQIDNQDNTGPFSPISSLPKGQKTVQSSSIASSTLGIAEIANGDINVTPIKRIIHGHCEPIYDLISVSNHHGSLNGGHYIAHVDTNYGRKTEKLPRWMCFNDARVSNANANSIAGPTAYVLFYRLREEPSTYTESGSGPNAAEESDL